MGLEQTENPEFAAVIHFAGRETEFTGSKASGLYLKQAKTIRLLWEKLRLENYLPRVQRVALLTEDLRAESI